VKKPSARTKAPDPTEDEEAQEKLEEQTSRSEELRDDEDILKACEELYEDVQQGFRNQNDRTNTIIDYWDLYNNKLGGNQFYSGNSKIFVPITNAAINARKTRFTNQIFPQSGRYVEAVSSDGTVPYAETALLEHYVRTTGLRSRIVPPLMRNGDVEGQYTLYCSWGKSIRYVAQKIKAPIETEDGPDPDDAVDEVKEETLTLQGPRVEVIADTDLLVLPVTVDSLTEALDVGGSVTIIRRWTRAKIKQLVKDGEIDKTEGDKLAETLAKATDPESKDKSKEMADDAGIKTHGGIKYAMIYETWTMLTIKNDEGEDERRLCRAYFGGEQTVLSVKRNPYWSDLLPIISAPVEKIQGVFKGTSKVAPVADMQYLANDAVNEAMDSAAYAMMPIVMTDPEKNPRVGSMILSLSAIWETDPKSTQFAQFPELWKQGFEIVATAKAEIFQSLGVNPSQITQGTGSKKKNQAEIATEQQVDILTTADVVTVIENEILTPLLLRFITMDHQFRNEKIMVRQFGEQGIRAAMEQVDPVTFNNHYQFRWFGVEAARSQQQVQQQIAGLNILRGIPPQQYEGYKLDLVPVIQQLVENTFGPRLAPQIFKDIRGELSVSPEIENQLLAEGIAMHVHPMDDFQQHMQAHIAELKKTGDPTGHIREHIIQHQAQMQKMQAAKMQAQMQQGAQPGGAPGGPKPGAQPGAQRPAQQPPGSIPPDQMQDPGVMPRRAG
jgi:hypothetical protein